MKDIKEYIIESTKDEDIEYEIGLALKDFGNERNGFKYAKEDDIKDALYKVGFDYDDENSNDDYMMFIGDYLDSKYEVELYIKDKSDNKVQIKHFNVFEV